jgi:hypothetical protein
MIGITIGPIAGTSAGLAAAVARPLTGDFGQGFRKVGLTAWSRFVLARMWLAWRGKLPWRIMSFLQDAHRRHILRQLGAIYQFRHHRLQTALEHRSPVTQISATPNSAQQPRAAL